MCIQYSLEREWQQWQVKTRHMRGKLLSDSAATGVHQQSISRMFWLFVWPFIMQICTIQVSYLLHYLLSWLGVCTVPHCEEMLVTFYYLLPSISYTYMNRLHGLYSGSMPVGGNKNGGHRQTDRQTHTHTHLVAQMAWSWDQEGKLRRLHCKQTN